MKKILIACALFLVVGAVLIVRAVRMPSQFGTFTGAPQAEVAALIARPQDFLHKTVTIEGTVREQCEAMGCFFFFHSGKSTLRIDLAQIAMNAPRNNGRLALVEGQIVPYDRAYQFLASAVKFE
jgi:hypothetical protein